MSQPVVFHILFSYLNIRPGPSQQLSYLLNSVALTVFSFIWGGGGEEKKVHNINIYPKRMQSLQISWLQSEEEHKALLIANLVKNVIFAFTHLTMLKHTQYPTSLPPTIPFCGSLTTAQKIFANVFSHTVLNLWKSTRLSTATITLFMISVILPQRQILSQQAEPEMSCSVHSKIVFVDQLAHAVNKTLSSQPKPQAVKVTLQLSSQLSVIILKLYCKYSLTTLFFSNSFALKYSAYGIYIISHQIENTCRIYLSIYQSIVKDLLF